jgi:diguanylate cyclase (GGDEF)-like protein/PAS domain S-box-containing protein
MRRISAWDARRGEAMHKLLARQLAQVRKATGNKNTAKTTANKSARRVKLKASDVDFDALCELVSAAYGHADSERERTAGSMSLMLKELDETHRRLLDAFDVIPEGVAVFDSNDRYVLWNKRYEEMYASSGSTFQIGMKFVDVLRKGLADGAFAEAAGREEEWLAERMARHKLPASTTEQELSDGRWVRIQERTTADGGSIGVRIDITDLKTREASFRLLFDSNPMPMWVYDRTDMRFLAVNEAALRHYGYTREQFLSMTLYDIRKADDWQQLRAFAPESGRSVGRNSRHVKADGTEIDIVIYSQQLTYEGKQAALVAAVDVTDRKRAEEDLRSTREFLDTVVNNVPATIVVKDARTLKYKFINRAGEHLYGISAEDFIGKTAHDIYPKELADEITGHDRDLAIEHEQVVDEHRLRMRDNTERIISSKRLAVVDARGEPEYLVTLSQDISDKIAAREQLAYLAHHDTLTDLPNRAAFNGKIATIIEGAILEGQQFGIICLDLDHFKQANDVFGHAVGDAVLQETARRFKRVSDGAFLARLGGDEFTFIIGAPVPQMIESLAERLQTAMAEPMQIGGHRITLGLSIGAAVYPTDGADQATLLNNADAALYRAKAEGRGTIRFFEPAMDKQLRERRLLQHELRDAVEGNQLALWYQPQATIDSEIVGFEALLRWNNHRCGYVPPDTFVPIAEESGLILPMSDWVLREACRQAMTWTRPLYVSVNLSPVQFQQDDLPALIHAVLLDSGLPAHRLQLEITEGVLINDCNRALAILRRIKALGVRIAMDDFGTGYSSLSYLHAFPFDKIKIDKSFVLSLKRNPQSAAIIRAVIGLGRSLNLPVAAEGVETKEQLAFLVHERCAEIQGYLIGRPLPIDAYGAAVGLDHRLGVQVHGAISSRN